MGPRNEGARRRLGLDFGDPKTIRLVPYGKKKSGGLLQSWFGKRRARAGHIGAGASDERGDGSEIQEQLATDPSLSTPKTTAAGRSCINWHWPAARPRSRCCSKPCRSQPANRPRHDAAATGEVAGVGEGNGPAGRSRGEMTLAGPLWSRRATTRDILENRREQGQKRGQRRLSSRTICFSRQGPHDGFTRFNASPAAPAAELWRYPGGGPHGSTRT